MFSKESKFKFYSKFAFNMLSYPKTSRTRDPLYSENKAKLSLKLTYPQSSVT